MRTIPAGFFPHLNALRDDQAFLWLFAIEVSDGEALHLVRNPDPVTFGGVQYRVWPVTPGEIEESGEGDVVSTTLTLANFGGIADTYLETASIAQRRVHQILVHAGDLASGEAIELVWTIQSAKATPATVTLQLATMPDLFSLPFPRRRFIRAHGFPGIPRRGRR